MILGALNGLCYLIMACFPTCDCAAPPECWKPLQLIIQFSVLLNRASWNILWIITALSFPKSVRYNYGSFYRPDKGLSIP